MSRILVIDDEPAILDVLGDILKDEGYEVFTAGNGPQGIAIIKNQPIDVIFLDILLPGKGGMTILQEVKADWPDIEVIVISGHANVDLAVKAIKLGAYDFLEKPLDIGSVLTLCLKAVRLKALRRENIVLRQKRFIEDDMIGDTEGIQRIREIVQQSTSSNSRVMIFGENGTGKEQVARMLHAKSLRAQQPFVDVNCAAIPDSLIESELFGHEKGAFTGAVARRKGKFETAHNGTLFLDEVADMSLNAQAKVLRAIQELSFERVGGEEPIKVDVRIISATNKDIQREITEGNFREDLYFRLNVISLTVPPLRERQDDILPLLHYFARKFSTGGHFPEFSAEAIKILKKHSWPGNIRELKNFVERVGILVDEKEVSAETAHFYLEDSQQRPSRMPDVMDYDKLKLSEARELFEQRFLERKLLENSHNISQTAQALGIYPSSLHGKIRKYGIETKK